MTILTQIYTAVIRFLAIRKKQQTLVPILNTKNRKRRHSHRKQKGLKHYMVGIVPLWNLNPPPPHPVHLRPPAFI